MFRFVEQLQRKPHHVRKNVAFGTSILATLLIAGIWISVSDFSSIAPAAGTIVIENEERETQTASPLKAIGSDFSRVREGFRSLAGYMDEESEIEVVADSEPNVHSDIESSESQVDYSFE